MNKVRIRLLAVLLMNAFTLTTIAQEIEIVKLLDKENSTPIVGATFFYGNQNGVSDNDGNIYFQFQPEYRMELSHINYGEWLLKELEVRMMMAEKVYYRQSITVNLYPVTVIALRPNEIPEESVKLDYQEQLAHDGASVLNQNPAFNSIRKGGNYGFDPVFRGFKYDQLNIVLNGAQGATAACPNRMDPPTSQMAPNMLDRIEVLKGPHALRYGTGIGATINFVPSKLRLTEEKEVYGRLSSGYEGNGSVLRNETKLGFSAKNRDVAFFGSWSQGNDYESGNGETVAAEFTRGSFGTSLGFILSGNNQLRLSAIYNVARDADFPALPMDLREDDTWLFNVRHDITFDNKNLSSWNTTLFASFVDHLMDNLLKPLEPRMLNAQTNASTFNYGARTEGIWNFTGSNLFAGADFRKEGAEGIREREFLMGPNAGLVILDNAWQDGHIAKSSVFAEYHFKPKSFQYVLSARMEVNAADINDPSSEFIQLNGNPQVTQFNPSFSFGATKGISKEMKVGLWLARAQRSGSLTERYINFFPVGQDPYEMLGNPQLKPEVSNQLDISLQWARQNSSLNFDVYASYLQDFISSVIDPDLVPQLPMSPGVRRYLNIEDAFKTGFEFSWKQQLIAGLQHQLGIAYTYAQDLERDEPLPEIAPLDFRYSLVGSYINNKLQPELVFRYVMEQSRISTEFGETLTPSFSLLDLKLAYQFTNSASIRAGVNNLFNENYFEHLNRSVRGGNLPIFAPGRNAFASINIVF